MKKLLTFLCFISSFAYATPSPHTAPSQATTPVKWAHLASTDDFDVELSPDSIQGPDDPHIAKYYKSFTLRIRFKELKDDTSVVDGKKVTVKFNGLIGTYIINCKDKVVAPVVAGLFLDKKYLKTEEMDAPHWFKLGEGAPSTYAEPIVCAGVTE